METIKDTLVVEVNGKKYKLNFEDIGQRLMIDPANLDRELEEQAAFYFWLATIATNAEVQAEQEKQGFDIFFSELQRDVRASIEEGGGKAPAAATVEAAAKATEEYEERLVVVLDAKRTASLAATVRDAVRMRQFLLIERSRRLSRNDAAEHDE